ncbi:hypothetical protein LL946_04735 [Knoellia locipacati]|uniref:hypothetical protein n=1 Tax=Knoellia locipacati TaxID=882824 RepID=UPI00384C05C8
MVSSFSWIPIQSAPKRPGEEYANLVSAPWVPPDGVLVVSGKFGAFAVMTAQRHEVMEGNLGDVTSIYRRDAGAPVTWSLITYRADGTAHVGDAHVTTAPPGAPTGWFEEVSAILEAHDEKVLAAARSAYRKERRGVALLKRHKRLASLASQPPSDLRWQVHGRKGPDARILVKRGRDIVGRLLLPWNVLTVTNEEEREAVGDFLEESGHSVRQPIHGTARGTDFVACVEWIGAWGVFQASFGDVPNRVPAALYFPPEKQLMVAREVWVEPFREVIERHGLPVNGILEVEVPDGYDPRLYKKLQLYATHGEYVSRPRRAQTVLAEMESLRRPAPPGPGPLSASVRELVPVSVCDAVDEWIDAGVIDPWARRNEFSDHVWWTHRTAALTDLQVSALTEVTPPGALPGNVDLTVAWAHDVSPQHVLMLAALRLRSEHPIWWRSLPWQEADLPRRGLTPTEHAQVQTSLTEMSAPQAAASGAPALVDALRSGALQYPDLPAPLSQNDHGRLFLAAGRLAHQGIGKVGVNFDPTSSCAVCSRGFSPAAHSLDKLFIFGTSQICGPCTEAADFRNPADRWGSLRTKGALDALKVLAGSAGGPPSRQLLRGNLAADATHEERIAQTLLRMPLPGLARIAGEPQWSWTDWLKQAGLLANGWRPSFGVHSTATDGHPCRSMLERHIDDWLFQRGIAHEVEPSYPFHADLNPTGLSADWLIEGIYVEAAGLMNRSDYAEKMSRKEALAAALDVEVIIVTQDDLDRLDAIFGRWLG